MTDRVEALTRRRFALGGLAGVASLVIADFARGQDVETCRDLGLERWLAR